MGSDPSVYIMGLGVPDPKGIFGTTLGLQEKYGVKRVLDMPTSENAMTGIAIGSALMGMRPIMTHQRVDFILLALDQLINNAAKWHYMFGGTKSVPLVIRLIIGRGWGQGPQHSQTLHSFFAHIPGLKVVMPSNPYDAKGLLVAAVQDNNPVIYVEHRWLHAIYGEVPSELYSLPLGQAKVVTEGSDLTLITCSHMTLEAFKAARYLKEDRISVEIIDLRTIKPLDRETILASVRKTGHVLIADPDWKTCGFAAEIAALIAEEAFDALKAPIKRLTYPDRLSPTSWVLANHFYPTAKEIAISALELLKRPTQARSLLQDLLSEKMTTPLDVPDQSFTGPF
jgi:pyruvate/2-oxoglutarate/acetoin dehydrogenase E1 component